MTAPRMSPEERARLAQAALMGLMREGGGVDWKDALDVMTEAIRSAEREAADEAATLLREAEGVLGNLPLDCRPWLAVECLNRIGAFLRSLKGGGR